MLSPPPRDLLISLAVITSLVLLVFPPTAVRGNLGGTPGVRNTAGGAGSVARSSYFTSPAGLGRPQRFGVSKKLHRSLMTPYASAKIPEEEFRYNGYERGRRALDKTHELSPQPYYLEVVNDDGTTETIVYEQPPIREKESYEERKEELKKALQISREQIGGITEPFYGFEPSALMAFDFDGVLVDSVYESSESAWRAVRSYWPDVLHLGLDQFKDTYMKKMEAVRPVVETGYENMILLRCLIEGMEVEEILTNWQTILPKKNGGVRSS
mmetsp:Transcript_1931/g.3785  ORF Transcript_1931/g.3785 Transcript_1931/m.3785 type:complete len:269 (-) Transcript_1931:1626-2432(-)